MPNNSNLLDGFAKHLSDKGKLPATIESYCRDANRFLDFLARSKLPPNRVQPETLISFQEHLTEDCSDSTNSIRRSIIGVRQFYRFLSDSKVMVGSPFDEVPIPQRNDSLPSALRRQDIAKVIRLTTADPSDFIAARNAVIFTLIGLEGMKATEVIGAKWADYLPGKRPSLAIRGSKARTIWLSEETSRVLDIYQGFYQEMRTHPVIAASREKMLLIAFRGRDASIPIPKMSRHGVKFIVYELGEKASINHLNTELLRHFAVNFQIELGKQPDEIMMHLGLRRLGNIAKHLSAIHATER